MEKCSPAFSLRNIIFIVFCCIQSPFIFFTNLVRSPWNPPLHGRAFSHFACQSEHAPMFLNQEKLSSPYPSPRPSILLFGINQSSISLPSIHVEKRNSVCTGSSRSVSFLWLFFPLFFLSRDPENPPNDSHFKGLALLDSLESILLHAILENRPSIFDQSLMQF